MHFVSIILCLIPAIPLYLFLISPAIPYVLFLICGKQISHTNQPLNKTKIIPQPKPRDNIIRNKRTKAPRQIKKNTVNHSPLSLPQEKDWFETIETVNVHDMYRPRPIPVNTINSMHKNPIYDIRGLDKAVCPKFVASPWLQSSAEPDRSSKSLCA